MVYLLTMVPVAGPLGRPQVPAPSIPGYGVLTMVPVGGPPGRPQVPVPCIPGYGVPTDYGTCSRTTGKTTSTSSLYPGVWCTY